MSEPSGASLEAPNFITLLAGVFHDSPFIQFLHRFETPFFSAVVIVLLATVARLALRPRARVPKGLQNAVEFVVESLDAFICGILGPAGRRYTPFIGTLFLYILTMNLIGLVPGFKSPTSNWNTTVALAVTVFLYVQFTGIKSFGFFGYLHHLAGSPQPRGIAGWLIACVAVPFNLVLHGIGELAKPLSLSVRLFGNIFAEDTLISAMVGMGILALSFVHSPVGLPLQVPFMLLVILTGTVQALVFTLLSTIYIFLMLPHEEHPHAAERGSPHHTIRVPEA